LVFNLIQKSNILDEAEKSKKIEEKQAWKCSNCGKVNPNYVTTCTCGETPDKSRRKESEKQTMEELKQYKELLDMGAITEEQFEEKKNQLMKKIL